MRLSFLGDALDHWKGSLFDSLRQADVVRELAIDPMASDLADWTSSDYEIFAHLLRVSSSQIIRHEVHLTERSRYFAEISHKGDLFLDPDTGVATGHVKDPNQYVWPLEIGQLLDVANDRLLMVYQHVRAQPVASRVDSVLYALQREVSPFHWCSYESGTVAMLFVAKQGGRIATTAKHLRELLGRRAEYRVREGYVAHL